MSILLPSTMPEPDDLRPTLVSYVVEAPVDALFGWYVLTEAMRRLVDSAEWAAIYQQAPTESRRLLVALDVLMMLDVDLPLQVSAMWSDSTYLRDRVEAGSVIQMSYYGALTGPMVTALRCLSMFMSYLTTEDARRFVGESLRLMPTSNWELAAHLGEQLIDNLIEQMEIVP